MTELKVVVDEAELARTGAQTFLQSAREAVARRGIFTVMLSGGNTPKKLYQRLASPELLEQIPWKSTHIFWGDERMVPPNHPESNFFAAWENLLRFAPIPGNQIHRVRTELGRAEHVAEDYEQQIRAFFHSGFDLILLGLGEDGHTVSLFPNVSLPDSGRLVLALWVPQLRAYRISVTPNVINSGRLVTFLVSGEKKANALKAVLDGPFDPICYPAQLVHPREGKTLWIIDAAAAPEMRDSLKLGA